MKSRYEEFIKTDDYFEPHDKSFESYIASHITSQQRFLITKYNLSKISSPPEDLKARLLFLIGNYRMFRCEAVFFKMDLPTLDLFRKMEFSQLVKYFPEFYVVEPLPMITLADYATSYPINGKILLRMLPSLLNTLALCHSNNFTYLNLSPFSIIVYGNVFWLRPPSLQPYAAPKCVFPPPPQSFRSSFRSINEMRFYRAPEWDSLPRFVQSDSWSLGAILGEYLVFGGPMFGAINIEDQMERTQMILGEAPPSLNWPPPTITATADLPDLIKELLDYDPRNRPIICIHITHSILDYIREAGVFGDDNVSRVSTMQDTENDDIEDDDHENSPPSYFNPKSSSHRSTPSVTSSNRCSCSSKHTSNSKHSSYSRNSGYEPRKVYSSNQYSSNSKAADQRSRSSSMATPSSSYSRSNATPSSVRSGSSVSSRRSTSNTPSNSPSVLSTPGTSASTKSRQSNAPSYSSSRNPASSASAKSGSISQSSKVSTRSSNAPSRSSNAPSRSSNISSRSSNAQSRSSNAPSSKDSRSQNYSMSHSSHSGAPSSSRISSESPIQDNSSSGNRSSAMSSKNSYSSRRRPADSSPQSTASGERRNRSPDAVSTSSARSNTSSRSYKSNRSSNRGGQADVKWINDNKSSSSSQPRRESNDPSYGTGTGLSASNGKRGEYKEIAPSPMPFHTDIPSTSSRSSSSKRRLFEEEENQPSFHSDTNSVHSNHSGSGVPIPEFDIDHDYDQDDELVSDPEAEGNENSDNEVEETEQKIEDIEKSALSDHSTDGDLEEEDFASESDHASIPSVKSYHTEPHNDADNDTISSAYSSPISSSKRSSVASSPGSASGSVASRRSYVSEEELEPQMSPPRVTFTEDYSVSSPAKSGSETYSSNPSGTYSYSTSSSAMELESIQRRIKTLEETFSQSRVDTTVNEDQNSPETSSSDGSEVRRQILNIGSRLEEFDGDLLVDCGGCSTNSIVTDNLHEQEVTLERTIEDLQNDSDI